MMLVLSGALVVAWAAFDHADGGVGVEGSGGAAVDVVGGVLGALVVA